MPIVVTEMRGGFRGGFADRQTFFRVSAIWSKNVSEWKYDASTLAITVVRKRQTVKRKMHRSTCM